MVIKFQRQRQSIKKSDWIPKKKQRVKAKYQRRLNPKGKVSRWKVIKSQRQRIKRNEGTMGRPNGTKGSMEGSKGTMGQWEDQTERKEQWNTMEGSGGTKDTMRHNGGPKGTKGQWED